MDPSDTEKSNDIITAKNVDLSSCDRELVQYPEAIQPHGVMLTVDDHSNLIVHASANCAQLLGAGPDAIIGKSADSVLGRTGRDLIGKLRRMALDGGPVHVARESFVGSDRGFHLFAHRSGGLIILEFETRRRSAPSLRRISIPNCAPISRGCRRRRASQNFFDLAVQPKSAASPASTGSWPTGSTRMAAGTSLPSRNATIWSRISGCIIPRATYPRRRGGCSRLSWVRHLPDVDYVPVPLVSCKDAMISGPVDMSFASLRSVSVMYSGYLKNMGVKATMVMPLMKEGKLWGLISAMHHSGPRHVPHETRMAAEFLAHTLSLLMSAKEDAEVFERVLAMGETTDRLIQALTLEPDFGKALGAPETLADVAGPGRGQRRGGGLRRPRSRLWARRPPKHEVRELAQWIGTQGGPIFATDRLCVAL